MRALAEAIAKLGGSYECNPKCHRLPRGICQRGGLTTEEALENLRSDVDNAIDDLKKMDADVDKLVAFSESVKSELEDVAQSVSSVG